MVSIRSRATEDLINWMLQPKYLDYHFDVIILSECLKTIKRSHYFV
jgi:hypothetical protein